MHASAVVDAAWPFADAPSKVPFYVAGGLLVGWAVLLALSGITHPGFPGSRTAGRFVMLTSAALVAATVTSAVLTGSGPEESRATQRPAAAGGLALAAPASGTPAFDRRSLRAPAGTVTIRFDNPSPAEHDVTIAAGGRTLAKSRAIINSTTTVSADLKPGSYTYYCSIDAHRQLGMKGTLTVG
jgi:plastocyanin